MSVYEINDNAGYKFAFTKLYTLGNKVIYEKIIEKKDYSLIAASNCLKWSKKFYSEKINS